MQQESTPQQVIEFPLRPKDRIQVTIKSDCDVIPTTYMSRVERMSGGEIMIRWPTTRGDPAPLQDNTIICLFFIKGSVAFAIDARVLKVMPHPHSIIVRCEGPLRRTQRRDYVRVPATIEVRLSARLVMATLKGEERPSYIITTTTVDISGGGFSIYHNAPLLMGSVYDVTLKIPTLENHLSLTAKVVRMEPTLNRMNETYYDIGFGFILIDEKIRRQIIKYVFRFQQNTLAMQL